MLIINDVLFPCSRRFIEGPVLCLSSEKNVIMKLRVTIFSMLISVMAGYGRDQKVSTIDIARSIKNTGKRLLTTMSKTGKNFVPLR